MRALALAPLMLLAACGPKPPVAAPTPALPSLGWRDAATGNDRERLREWRSSFIHALASARRAGNADEIAREGVLLQPDAALGGGPIPSGDYRCRMIKVGAKSEGVLGYVAYPYFRCRVGGGTGIQSFAKLTGSQRLFGRIHPGDAVRQVFLGTLVLGDETLAMRYGADRERNVAAYVERIGPARWRMVMPRPHFESQLDVLELIPAT